MQPWGSRAMEPTMYRPGRAQNCRNLAFTSRVLALKACVARLALNHVFLAILHNDPFHKSVDEYINSNETSQGQTLTVLCDLTYVSFLLLLPYLRTTT